MINSLETDIFDLGYKESLKMLLDKGYKVNPRGLQTIELSPFYFKLNNPRTRIITNKSRNINLGFNIAEFLSIIGADDKVKTVSVLNSSVTAFSDNGDFFRGAYGPRLRTRHSIDQFEKVIEKLKNDTFSRQAIMVIFDPYYDYTQTKDVPCTISFHFLLRNNKLHMNTYMRSNDAMLGHVIDVFTFTMIQELIATEIECDLGTYNHFVGSFHLYEKDINKAKKIIDDTNIIEDEMPKMKTALKDAKLTYDRYIMNIVNSSFEEILLTNKFFTESLKIHYSDNYWNDLYLCTLYQKEFKNKQYNNIHLNQLNSSIYRKYFERKIKNV